MRPERFNHDELSAIQHAMNLKLQDEAAFFAEYQNEPLPEETVEPDELTADQIAGKLNRLRRGEVPIGCNHVTMFIDVQANLLFYVVAAWEEDFTGYIIDYGTYPDQKRPYFTLRDARHTLAAATKAGGLEGAINAGLEALSQDYLGREWRRDDGAMLRIERCLIDVNWGSSTEVVSSVDFSPDGQRLASGSYDGTLKVWDARKGPELLTLQGHTGGVSSVAFSPDGKRISSRDSAGKVLTWDATTGQLLPDADPMPLKPQDEAASRDGSLRVFIERGQIKVVRLPDSVEAQKRRQAEERAFLERLARPNPAYHRQQADWYEKSGEHFAAAFHLRRLLQIEPTDEAVRRRLAAIEARLRTQAKSVQPEKPPAKMP